MLIGHFYLALAFVPTLIAGSYTFQSIPNPAGQTQCGGAKLQNNGTFLLGCSSASNLVQDFFWNGTNYVPLTYSDAAGRSSFFAQDLNSSGQISGTVALLQPAGNGFNVLLEAPAVRQPDGTYILQPVPAGKQQGDFATAINDAGAFIAILKDPGVAPGILYQWNSVGGSAVPLSSTPAAIVQGLNSLGSILYSSAAGNETILRNGVAQDLGVGGVTPVYFNDLDQAVIPSGFVYFFFDGTSLQPFPAGYSAAGLNNLGVVLVQVGGTNGLWQGGVFTDLGSQFSNVFLVDINDRGQILVGSFSDGNSQLALATPVPEPSTISFSTVGIALMVSLLSRRRRR